MLFLLGVPVELLAMSPLSRLDWHISSLFVVRSCLVVLSCCRLVYVFLKALEFAHAAFQRLLNF